MTGLLRAIIIAWVRPCAKVVISSDVKPPLGRVVNSCLMRGGAFTTEGVALSSSDSCATTTTRGSWVGMGFQCCS